MPVQCTLLFQVLRFAVAFGQGGVQEIGDVKSYTPSLGKCQHQMAEAVCLIKRDMTVYAPSWAASLYQSRRLSSYTSGVIYLTRSWRFPPFNFVDQYAQLHQIIRSKPRASRGGLRKRIGIRHARPRGQHRAQTALRVEKHHSVLTPVLSARQQNQSGAALRMKGMRDLEMDCLGIRTASSC
jgi:hypothetical protein